MQPANTVLSYVLGSGASYVDIAMDLSKINRRGYEQGMRYAVRKIEIYFDGVATTNVQSVKLKVATAGNTWTVHNAWTKAQAHWIAQQRTARRLIGQSAKPKWEDFKVYLDDAHRAAGNETLVDLNADPIGSGEWEYSRFVYENDDASVGEPHLHLIGGDIGATDFGLILAYQQSRATVQAEDPDLPDEYSSNLYARMATDTSLVADEVAHNMEQYNDEPPYDHDDYVGNDTNGDWPMLQQICAASLTSPVGTLGGFVAECGLLRLETRMIDNQGNPQDAPNMAVNVHLVPGGYKGVLAESMGQ